MLGWVKEFDGAVTVCDQNFTIVYMNDRAITEFENDGGKALIGSNLLDCHNEESRKKIKELLKSGESNTYIRKKSDGRKKVIHQVPWIENGNVKGLVELSFYL